jgi:hypothetical protein
LYIRLFWLCFRIILNASICTILLSFLRLSWLYGYSSIAINCYIVWYGWQFVTIIIIFLICKISRIRLFFIFNFLFLLLLSKLLLLFIFSGTHT